jgi:hypothetical protein
MKLLGFNQGRNLVHFVRELDATEVADHEKFTPIIAEAKNRFNLFRILAQNYLEWKSYVDSLLNAKTMNDGGEMLQLDRLLLNYLTCAYTIQEHFKVSFQQRFRKNIVKQKENHDFIDGLCKNSWEFAFLLDFRGYVQHCGLGVGHFNRDVTNTSVTLLVSHNAAVLVSQAYTWRHSKLTGKEGDLDLVVLLQEFHCRMMQQYAPHMAKTLYPDLFPAAEFYGRLAEEVRRIDSNFRMVFHPTEIHAKTEGDKQTVTLNLIVIPNDVFAELGIYITKKN